MSKRILLADDSITIHKVVELTFLDEDFEIAAVSNGAQALARLEEGRPDLVIADVHMPGASGFDVCRRSKDLYPGVPVLLLVGTFEPFDPAEATAAGADRYLKKPFDSQELLRLAKELAAAARPSPPAAAVTAPPVAAPAAIAVAEEAAKLETDVTWTSFLSGAPAATEVKPPADLWQAAPVFSTPAWAIAAEPEPPSEPEPEPVAFEPEPPPAAANGAIAPAPDLPATAFDAHGRLLLADEEIERIARRVAELIGAQTVREVAWEVVPDLAEVAIKQRIRELESQLE